MTWAIGFAIFCGGIMFGWIMRGALDRATLIAVNKALVKSIGKEEVGLALLKGDEE